MLEIVKPGLETSVQDYPGRIGYWAQGFPPSGPMDSWSFRLANRLVGNPPGASALECQFLGPTIRFRDDTVIAITGAEMDPRLDGEPVPMWETVAVRAEQELALTFARIGARAYIAIAGGIDTPLWLGSRSTFHKAGVGGMDGHAVKAGQVVPVVVAAPRRVSRRVPEARRPPISRDKQWLIEAVRGPNDEWIDDTGHARFATTEWKLSGKSDRTGFRLEGPEWTFTAKALNKAPEHGSEPSNIIDQGYPLGAVNLSGQTPIILVHDGPSMGGFICPYTIASAAFWKLGQSKPGDVYKMKVVSVAEAQVLRRELDRLAGAEL
jgi:5-oxoprolinase (ATP-hydrolysing) subunit C